MRSFTSAIRIPLLIAFLVSSIVSTLPLFGQERFGEINGAVLDASKSAIPGATVTITNKASNRVLTLKTGGDGAYIARDLEPGRYSVRFQATGFQGSEVQDVNLLVGQRLKVDGILNVGSIEQTVQVTEAAPLIDTSRVSISHNVTAEEFDRLPKARTFQSLAMASPSVNSGEIEGGFQVNGASGAENQFVIDGVSTTSLINGKSRQDAVFEILQEVQVKTGGIDAEYGGALGGVISAITKSGGNAFHGDLHYYLSGNSLNAGPVLRLNADPVTERLVSHIQDTKQTDNQNEIGGSLGGYFIKDKLYFFSAFSPRFRNQEGTYKFNNGTESAKMERDSSFHQMFNKLSWDPTSRVRTNFSWLWSPTKVDGYIPTLKSFAPDTTPLPLSAVTPLVNSGYFQPQSSYTGQVDISVTPTALLTIRGGRFWDNFKSTGLPNLASITYSTSATNLPFDIPVALRQPRNFANIGRVPNVLYDIVTRTFIQTDFSKFGNFLGQHNLKGGWGFTKTVNRMDNREMGGGYVNVFWNSQRVSSDPTTRGTFGYYEFNDRRTAGVTGAGMHNLFIQDQWRITRRLSLTLGLRVENEKVPTFRRDIKDYGFEFGFADKIAPRVGASYDVFGDGKLKLYGSWGRYFDWVKYELSRGTFGGDIWRVYYRALDTADVFSLLNGATVANLPGRNVWSSPTFRDRRVPSFDLVAKDIKPMSQDNMNVGVEFQIAPQTVFRGNYVHNKLRRTIEDLGALDANGDEVYLYGNPGEGQASIQPTQAGTGTKPFPMPKPLRKYDAMELSINRRFSKGMFGSFSYTLSRLYGNYAGIASSDEITSPATGNSSLTAQQLTGSISRPGGNANRAWDLDEVLFDSHGNVDQRGRLATDRPHVFKLYGNKEFNWKSQTTDLGLFQYAGSGTPLTMTVTTVNTIPIMVEGRGSMGRTPFLTQTDFMVGHTIVMGENKRLRFEFNALNVFNQKTARSRFTSLNRGSGAGGGEPGSAIDLSHTDLFKGFDYRTMLNTTADQLSGRGAYDPLFGLSDIFNTGFQGRFGVKFSF